MHQKESDLTKTQRTNEVANNCGVTKPVGRRELPSLQRGPQSIVLISTEQKISDQSLLIGMDLISNLSSVKDLLALVAREEKMANRNHATLLSRFNVCTSFQHLSFVFAFLLRTSIPKIAMECHVIQ